ncbi:MAG: response regulator transcription factor [Bryobacterales bacterium]|nr:response regulator transcription factor [Bryobacterales bacterium]
MSTRIRALIADDEPLARLWLRGLLQEHPDIDVIEEAGNGIAAIEHAGALSPDVLFLDVDMPELDGFGVVEALGDQRPHCIVFVTAHDRFALQAFEVHALDYLLKPFDAERLRKTLDRVRAQLATRTAAAVPEKLAAILEALHQPRKQDRIAVKDNGRVFFLRTEDIRWVEACGNYVKLYTAGGSHLLLQTMAGMEARLDTERFLRIHRSAIVNIDAIHSIEPLFHGDYEVRLKTGEALPLSRGYRDRLQALIERSS